MISLVSISTLPGRMIALRRVQHNSKCSGFVARARQISGTRSIFLVALMSSNTARTRALVVFSLTSLTVLMTSFLKSVGGDVVRGHYTSEAGLSRAGFSCQKHGRRDTINAPRGLILAVPRHSSRFSIFVPAKEETDAHLGQDYHLLCRPNG